MFGKIPTLDTVRTVMSSKTFNVRREFLELIQMHAFFQLYPVVDGVDPLAAAMTDAKDETAAQELAYWRKVAEKFASVQPLLEEKLLDDDIRRSWGLGI